MSTGWEHFAHGADIGVAGTGPTPADAFANAAVALTAVLTDPAEVHPRVAIDVHGEAPDLPLLFVDFLNALVFEMATRRMLFAKAEVHVAGTRFDARLWGEPVDIARHQPAVEVKGATCTALEVARQADGTWRAQCVVDV